MLEFNKSLLILLTFSLLSGCQTFGTKPSSETLEPEPTNSAVEQTSAERNATAEAWFQRGNALLEQNQSLQAIEAYHRALQIDSSHTSAWHNLGLIYLRRATIAFENLVKHASDDPGMKKRGEYVVNAMEKILQEGFQ